MRNKMAAWDNYTWKVFGLHLALPFCMRFFVMDMVSDVVVIVLYVLVLSVFLLNTLRLNYMGDYIKNKFVFVFSLSVPLVLVLFTAAGHYLSAKAGVVFVGLDMVYILLYNIFMSLVFIREVI